MASTAGNGSPNFKFNGGNIMPQDSGSAAGFNPATYGSKGGSLAFSELKGGEKQKAGSLAFSELKGGKRRRSRKTAKRVAKKTSKRRGKKTMKTMLKGLFGIFKK
jgi:hypothetical protein